MAQAKKLATYDDLLALAEDVKAEVVHGTVVVAPPPFMDHGAVQRKIGRFIGGPFDDDDGRGGPGGWWIAVEVDVRLHVHEIVRPDVAGWRRERLPQPWGKRPVDVVPDWICEVLSPSNTAHDRVTKRELYARYGVAHYWIIDPAAGTLESFRLEQGRWTDSGAFDVTALARIPPFEAIELEVARLFPELPVPDGG